MGEEARIEGGVAIRIPFLPLKLEVWGGQAPGRWSVCGSPKTAIPYDGGAVPLAPEHAVQRARNKGSVPRETVSAWRRPPPLKPGRPSSAQQTLSLHTLPGPVTDAQNTKMSPSPCYGRDCGSLAADQWG